jgi:hypothetical protein
MTLYSIGYSPNEESRQNRERQFELFRDHLPLILEHERDILGCADYFFCPLEFAYCSWAWVGGDGPLYLGYLFLGWRDRSFTGVCPACGGTVLVTSFGGSILSGSNGCRGSVNRAIRNRSADGSNWAIDGSSSGTYGNGILTSSANGRNTTVKFSVGAAMGFSRERKSVSCISRWRIRSA